MKKVRNLNSVEKELGLSILATAMIVFIISLVGQFIILTGYVQNLKNSAEKELESVLAIYTSNLLSHIGVMAGATEFMEFVRSGELTRGQLRNEFIELMSRLPGEKEITGWEIVKHDDGLIFSLGVSSDTVLIIPLCYTGDRLHARYGRCVGELHVYLSQQGIISELQKINPAISECNCEPVKSLPPLRQNIYGAQSEINLPVVLQPQFEYQYFILYMGISIIGIWSVCLWARKRTKETLYKEIINPITGISQKIKPELGLSSVQEIVDIRFRQEVLEARTAAEAVRSKKLACTINNVFSTLMSNLKQSIEQLENNFSAEKYADVLERLDDLSSSTDNFIEFLRPEVLDTLGVSKSLALQVREWQERNNNCNYVAEIECDENLDLPDAVSNAVYEITRESLSNIENHSQAKNVFVELHILEEPQGKFLYLSISDDGLGFEPELPTKGLGLSTMKARVVSLGGVFSVDTDPGKGTLISIEIPLKFTENHMFQLPPPLMKFQVQ